MIIMKPEKKNKIKKELYEKATFKGRHQPIVSTHVLLEEIVKMKTDIEEIKEGIKK